jgi:hypothetical protein
MVYLITNEEGHLCPGTELHPYNLNLVVAASDKTPITKRAQFAALKLSYPGSLGSLDQQDPPHTLLVASEHVEQEGGAETVEE